MMLFERSNGLRTRCVFVTHPHLDHYDQAYHYLSGPRSDLNLGCMQITTIDENHDGISGVCYLVEIDGICLYFSADKV